MFYVSRYLIYIYIYIFNKDYKDYNYFENIKKLYKNIKNIKNNLNSCRLFLKAVLLKNDSQPNYSKVSLFLNMTQT